LIIEIFFLIIFFLFSSAFSFFYFYQGKEKVNLLLLGESGPGREGATLTDTMIFASVSKKGIILLSIPRDIWYQPLQTKINSLNFYGGLPLVKRVVEEILGQKIDMVFLVDFDSFVEFIDVLGGIDIYVERAFDDFKYPIPGKENDLCNGDKSFSCRYEHIHFDSGWQHMDGETTLKFVRSRQAEGEEGTDFARSLRQQKVIEAVKSKIFSFSFLLDYQKISSILKIFREKIKKDIGSVNDLFSLGKILIYPSSRKASSFVLEGKDSSGEFLYHPKFHYSGQWVLLPVGGNWEKIQKFVSSIL